MGIEIEKTTLTRLLDNTAGKAAFEEWKNWFGTEASMPFPFDWEELTITGRTTWEKIAMAAIKFHQDSGNCDYEKGLVDGGA